MATMAMLGNENELNIIACNLSGEVFDNCQLSCTIRTRENSHALHIIIKLRAGLLANGLSEYEIGVLDKARCSGSCKRRT